MGDGLIHSEIDKILQTFFIRDVKSIRRVDVFLSRISRVTRKCPRKSGTSGHPRNKNHSIADIVMRDFVQNVFLKIKYIKFYILKKNSVRKNILYYTFL